MYNRLAKQDFLGICNFPSIACLFFMAGSDQPSSVIPPAMLDVVISLGTIFPIPVYMCTTETWETGLPWNLWFSINSLTAFLLQIFKKSNQNISGSWEAQQKAFIVSLEERGNPNNAKAVHGHTLSSQSWHLWAYVCKTGQIALLRERIVLQCNIAMEF